MELAVLLKESRFSKISKTFNGHDVKAPAKDFKDFFAASFGKVGLIGVSDKTAIHLVQFHLNIN